MDPITKRRYNLTYKAHKKGIKINGRKRRITIYFDEIPKLIKCQQACELITHHDFKTTENRQLKMRL
jgi:hypothetical protein